MVPDWGRNKVYEAALVNKALAGALYSYFVVVHYAAYSGAYCSGGGSYLVQGNIVVELLVVALQVLAWQQAALLEPVAHKPVVPVCEQLAET